MKKSYILDQTFNFDQKQMNFKDPHLYERVWSLMFKAAMIYYTTGFKYF